ncbi:MAG: hypothetical protein Q4A76_05920 [Porphyromonadaceae bacterium]|nr:hypothetical protein [Porphyromonadaceae bacterium]
MKMKLLLKNPIFINGVEVNELDYDTNKITPTLFAQAEAAKKQAAGMKNVAIVPAVEFDFALHTYLGFAAIIAEMPHVDFLDLERLLGADVVYVMRIGRNFILKSEESMPNDSDARSENMQENLVQA